MYNRSISLVPGGFNRLGGLSPLSSSDQSLVSEWQESVRAFNNSDRVPVMFYLRPVPRLKPLGSAITSVFVSTFAMLSTLWSLFHIVAGAFARPDSTQTDDSVANVQVLRAYSLVGSGSEKQGFIDGRDRSNSSLPSASNEEYQSLHATMERLSLTLDNHIERSNIAIAEVQLAMAQMRLSLQKSPALRNHLGKNYNEALGDLSPDSD
ncbi:hypothetical protein C8J57DRAFT_1306988 [Mycena rebaudengoi]|nr:hypothetical protein C8J57DRAFT_1306988 [Mycena rebaudengoi]